LITARTVLRQGYMEAVVSKEITISTRPLVTVVLDIAGGAGFGTGTLGAVGSAAGAGAADGADAAEAAGTAAVDAADDDAAAAARPLVRFPETAGTGSAACSRLAGTAAVTMVLDSSTGSGSLGLRYRNVVPPNRFRL